jgi:RHS repeat-associated protein
MPKLSIVAGGFLMVIISFRWLRLVIILGLTAVLFQLHTPVHLAVAQTLHGDFTLQNPGSIEPIAPVVTRMNYQPPLDAAQLSDFAPATAAATTLTVTVGQTADRLLSSGADHLVALDNNLAAVVIEAQTFAEPTRLEFTPLAVPVPADPQPGSPPLTVTNTISNPLESRHLMAFQLELVNAASGQAIETFDKPVRLVVDLRPLTANLNPVYSSYFLAYQDPDDPLVWREVDITVHQAGGLISAETNHFSGWAAGVRPERWNPSWTPPTVSAFSGAATYSYPIEVPPGRNGLQPNVTLSYSSRAIDGRIRDGESGPIGDGWSLAQISVARVGVKLENVHGHPWTHHPDKFRLVFNGAGHELFPASNTMQNIVRYYVKDAPGYFLERHYSAAAPNLSGIFWILKTPDGQRYRLGYRADAEEWQSVSDPMHLEVDGHEGRSTTASAVAWHLDTVTDSFGNQMTYAYHTRDHVETIDWYQSHTGLWLTFPLTSRRNRINTIAYNYPSRVTTLPPANDEAWLNETSGSRIEFRAANLINDEHAFLINSIYIYHGGGTNPISEYRIQTQGLSVASPGCWNYDVVPEAQRHSHTRIVNAIQQYVDTDNDSTTNGSEDPGYALPPVTFSYAYEPHFNNSGAACFQFYYLTGYQNGYGGSVNFTYTSDNRQVGDYQHLSYTVYEWPKIGYNYSVSEVAVNDGRNDPVATTYTYSQPCYAQSATAPSGATNCAEPNAPDEYGNIVGYLTATETNYDYDGETVLKEQITTFSQNATNTIGRPEQIDVQNAGGTLLARTTHEYASETINGLPNMFTYVIETGNYQYNNGLNTPVLSTKTRYEYNTTIQGGGQYGNLTHIREYTSAAAHTSAPYRTTIRSYNPNVAGSYWLVAPLKGERVYQGDGATLLRGSWLHYDDSDSESAAPTQGALTRSRSFRPISCSAVPGGGGAGCDNGKAYQTIEMIYGYDLYGNQTSSVSYSDYGYRTFNVNWDQLVNTHPSDARTTQIAYEDTYNLYPISTTNPASQTTDFQIYGFNGAPLDGFQKQPGLLKQVTGPDSVTTKYEYDPFGRLHAVYDGFNNFSGFGDSEPWNGDPLTRYRYWDNSWNENTLFLNPADNAPFLISEQKRPGSFPAPAGSSSGFAYADQTFYDGFGRPIQTRSVWRWVQGQSKSREVITSTAYHALGPVRCQTVPYDVAFYNDRRDDPPNWPNDVFVNEACASKPRTTTSYDALGRPLVVTAPDGSATSYNYAITDNTTVNGLNRLRRVQVYDALNQVTNYFYDWQGQLVKARENLGAAAPYTSYADTEYTYNVLGNLTWVRAKEPTVDGSGALLRQTQMSYNNFGHKTSMTDLDMGSWTYQYDAAGNLVSQVDANDARLCFSYDSLDRLTYKRYDSANNGCDSGDAQLAHYLYFASGEGQAGRLSEIRWSASSVQNRETFNYDSLGRLTAHTRIIDDQSFTLSYGNFDSLHRPHDLTYPRENELVQLSYDREGENSLTAGGNSLVTNVTYNARGQIRELIRPVGISNSYYFYYNAAPVPAGTGNGAYRLKEIQHGNDADSKPDFIYTYDKTGNALSMVTKTTTGGVNYTDTQSFGYDALNRLTSAVASGGVANYSHSYAYDKLGNIISYTGLGSYDYLNRNANCPAPQPAHSQPQAVKQIGGRYYCYDKNGNMTRRVEDGVTYIQTFDVQNRLVSVDKSVVGTTTFAYDAAGIRVKTVKPDGTMIYTPFPQFEEEIRPAPPTPTPTPTTAPTNTPTATATNTPTNTPTATATNTPAPTNTPTNTPQPTPTGTLIWEDKLTPTPTPTPCWFNCGVYEFGDGDMMILSGETVIQRSRYMLAGQTIAVRVSGDPVSGNNGLAFYYTDHLGSASIMLKSNGDFVSGSTARYHPFGSYRTTPTQTVSDRRYTGHAHNDDLGLIYMNARYYVGSIGRFASADTLIPNPTNPQSWNRYAYVENRPLNFTDPTGHWLESAWDAFNVGLGIVSLADNLSQGNYGWAAVDAVGIAVDTAALILPVVPGGVGTIIKAARGVDTAVDAIQTVNRASNAAQAANQAANIAQASVAAGNRADNLGSVYIRAVPTDQIGTSQPFKLRQGEDGLSVFQGVSPNEVLTELPGHRIANTTVSIPANSLPPGTQVISTAAPQLSQRLSDAHRILIRPEGWSANRFAKELKRIVGWD